MAVERTNGKPRQPKCPTCGKLSVVKFAPFCSKHCADLDLGRWLTESYRIPLLDEEGDDEDEQ